MRKLNFAFCAIASLVLISCSKNSACNNILEPQGNEFTVNCDRFKMELGRLNLNVNPNSGVTSCKISFVNNDNGNGFNFQSNDNNINFVDIWLIIPEEHISLQSIPVGTYQLNNQIDGGTNQPDSAFDIVDWNRIIIGAKYNEDNDRFLNHTLYGSDFDEANVVVSKSGNIYDVSYSLSISETTIKGYFKGELEVVDAWD